MIKFFRKIRQNLLSEGKTGKYLKYAIGEIILVVIGILIALSLNNWNENRKNKSLLKAYTTSLIKDLEKDTLVLNQTYDWVENDIKLTKNLIRRLSSPTANYDTLISIANNDLKTEYKLYRSPNRNTLLNMQEKGLLELYDDEIFNSITDLQTTQNISENIFVLNDDLYIKQVDRLLSEYVIGEYKIINGPLSIKTSEATDKVELFKRIEAFLSVKLSWSQSSNFLRMKLLNKSVLIINKLNEIK